MPCVLIFVSVKPNIYYNLFHSLQVLDSSFSSLPKLIPEVLQNSSAFFRILHLGALAKALLPQFRKAVQNRGHSDINSVSPIEAVAHTSIPALFGEFI